MAEGKTGSRIRPPGEKSNHFLSTVVLEGTAVLFYSTKTDKAYRSRAPPVSEICPHQISEMEDKTMPRWDKYAPDYSKLYPGVTITPSVKRVLTGSDRKMKYFERDLKTDRRRENKQTGEVKITPAREDSLDRLVEDNNQQYALTEMSPEDALVERDDVERLHCALRQLEPEEYALIDALYYQGIPQKTLAEQFGITQQGISKRIKKVHVKIKKFMKI